MSSVDGQRSPALLRKRLREFAAEFAHLPLYHRITAAAADDPEALGLLMQAQPGQARPPLLLATLHDLVLRRPDLPAARWYPSVVGRDSVPVDGDPWPDVRQTLLDHRDELRYVISTRTTQTNEVNRTVYLAPLIAAASADVPDVPVALVELGASAGLLLAIDRYSTTIRTLDHLAGAHPIEYGDPTSPVRCVGSLLAGPTPPTALPPIIGRVGIDRTRVSLTDPDAVRWLEACLWPDVPGRTERFAAAVDLLRTDPPAVRSGDLVDDLPDAADAVLPAASAAHLVVFSSWALTYLAKARRSEVAAHLAAVARARGIPVSWVSAEPAGAVPQLPLPPGWTSDHPGTVLGLRRWRSGHELAPIVVGTAHPHGEWLQWH